MGDDGIEADAKERKQNVDGQALVIVQCGIKQNAGDKQNAYIPGHGIAQHKIREPSSVLQEQDLRDETLDGGCGGYTRSILQTIDEENQVSKQDTDNVRGEKTEKTSASKLVNRSLFELEPTVQKKAGRNKEKIYADASVIDTERGPDMNQADPYHKKES